MAAHPLWFEAFTSYGRQQILPKEQEYIQQQAQCDLVAGGEVHLILHGML